MRTTSILIAVSLLATANAFATPGEKAPRADLYVGRTTDNGFTLEGWKDGHLIAVKGDGDSKVTRLISPDELIVSKKDGDIVLHYVEKGAYGHRKILPVEAPAEADATQNTASVQVVIKTSSPTQDFYVGRTTDNGFLITERLQNGHLVVVKSEETKNVVKTISPDELIISKKNGEIVFHYVPNDKTNSFCQRALLPSEITNQ